MTVDSADQPEVLQDPAAARGRNRWCHVSLGSLVVVSVVAWLMYAWAAWPHHWQSRSMHVILFMPWTMAWHATVRAWVSQEKTYRPWLAGCIPVLAAFGGEAVQFVWKASGHDPEWRGVACSLLGVGLGWVAMCWWSLRKVATAPLVSKN